MTSVVDRGAQLLFDDGKAYNHATDNRYKQLRAKAEGLYDKRHKLSQQSQQAYKSGNKQKAHELSEQSKKLLTEAEYYNHQAAEYVFRENNTDSAEDEIDLHGLFVKEAVFFLQTRIAAEVQRNSSHLKVIVGKGLHSQNGIAKLKPAIDQMCTESRLKHYIDKDNTGVLVIDLRNTHPDQIPSSWSTGGAAGYPSLGYQGTSAPQYQPHHQQSHHQLSPQGFKTGNTFVDLFIKVLCICINK